MMNRVSSKIITDAEARVREIEADYAESALRLEDEHRTAMQERGEQFTRDLDELRRTETGKYDALLGIERNKCLLTAKWNIISGLLAEAQKTIRQDHALYMRYLESTIIRGAVTGREEIVVSDEDRMLFNDGYLADLNRKVAAVIGRDASLRLSSETRETGGGVFLSESRAEINATLDKVIQSVFDDFLIEIAALLFGNGNGGTR